MGFYTKVVIAVSSMALLFVLFYLLIISPFFAQYKPVISLRNIYISTFGKKVSSYSISPIRPIRTDSRTGLYVYGLKGMITKIDPVSNLITLTAEDNKQYLVSTDILDEKDEGWVIIQGTIDNLEGKRIIDYYFYTPDLSLSITKDENSTPDRIYHFIWQDKRTLSDILKDLETKPNTPINMYEGVKWVGLFR